MNPKTLFTVTLLTGALALAVADCKKKPSDDHYEGKVKANDEEVMGHTTGPDKGLVAMAAAMGPTARPRRAPRPMLGARPSKYPQVHLKTTLGSIVLELFTDKAPISAKNFLTYVDAGFYNGTIFHRVIPNFMIQGGGLTPDMKKKPTRPPIKNEADNGLKNKRGTVAMARLRQPNSATAQFFINVKDNPHLDHKGPGRMFGYAVFARVKKGMDVVDKIRNTPTTTKNGRPNVPQTPILITKAQRK